MTTEVVVSKLGIRFTAPSVAFLRYATTVTHGDILCFSVARLADGSLQIGLGGDHAPHPAAIADNLEGVVFYWYADPEMLAVIRAGVVDSPGDRGTRLIEDQGDEGGRR